MFSKSLSYLVEVRMSRSVNKTENPTAIRAKLPIYRRCVQIITTVESDFIDFMRQGRSIGTVTVNYIHINHDMCGRVAAALRVEMNEVLVLFVVAFRVLMMS